MENFCPEWACFNKFSFDDQVGKVYVEVDEVFCLHKLFAESALLTYSPPAHTPDRAHDAPDGDPKKFIFRYLISSSEKSPCCPYQEWYTWVFGSKQRSNDRFDEIVKIIDPKYTIWTNSFHKRQCKFQPSLQGNVARLAFLLDD